MIDVGDRELVELATLADGEELGEDGGDLALDLCVVGDVVGGDDDLNVLGNDDGGLHKYIIVWPGDLVNRFPNCIEKSFGRFARRARDDDVNRALPPGVLTVRLSEQDAWDALRRIDERVLNRPRCELRPRAERPGLEPVVVLGVAALPGYPVGPVGDLVDAVEEGQAPGDLALGDIVPGALHLGLDEDVNRSGPLLENRRLEDEEAELLAVDVLLRLEDVALLDLDRVPLCVRPGHGDEALGLLRLLALLGVVRRLEVEPCP